MEATQTATGHVSAATVLAAGQEGAKAMTIAEKLIAATSKKARKAAILLLEDGTRFDGWACGAAGEVTGEICFNTSLEGYLEVITDPSYAGQIVTMTYPQIGNYGVNLDDTQSAKPALRGLVVHDMCRTPSNWRSSMSLPEFLERENIVAIEGIDTRALVRHIRDFGAQTAILSTEDLDAASLAEKVAAAPSLVGRNLAKTVSRAAAGSFDKVPESQAFAVAAPAPKKYPGLGKKIAAGAMACVLLAVLIVTGAAARSERVVNVCSWGEYIDETLLDEFTQQTGIKVNYTTYSDNESLYSMLSSGTADYDVIIPSDYMISRLISEGMLEKLDFSRSPTMWGGTRKIRAISLIWNFLVSKNCACSGEMPMGVYFMPSSSTAILLLLPLPPKVDCQLSRTRWGSLMVPGCSKTPPGAAPLAKNLAPYSSQAIAMPMAFLAIAIGE